MKTADQTEVRNIEMKELPEEPDKCETAGALFIQVGDGKPEKICDVSVPMEIQKEQAGKGEEADLDQKRMRVLPEEMSVEFTMQMSRLDLLSIIYGFRVTNNWLKMHGGIMTRRGGKRKQTSRPGKRGKKHGSKVYHGS